MVRTMNKNNIYKIPADVGVHDFEHTFGRLPKNEEEFEEFGRLCSKGVHAQIDWDIIFECAKEEMI